MNIKLSFVLCATFVLGFAPVLAPVARAQKAKSIAPAGPRPPFPTRPPAPIVAVPIAQTQGQGVTIRLKRARWATGREVLAWPWMDKALTLWFDAQASPALKLPADLTAADYIVNSRLVDDKGRAVEMWPVDTVRSLHRSSLPYVPISPKLKLHGQSLWRARDFDPNFKAVKVQVEWLKPGSPFTSKNAPDSLLDLKAGAPIPPAAAPWLQKVEMSLPANRIEIGALRKFPKIVARQENQDYKATLYRWQSGTTTYESGGERTSFPTIQMGLTLTAKNDDAAKNLSKPITFVARSQGDIAIKSSHNGLDNARYFGPDGQMVKSNQRCFEISLDNNEKPFELAGPWSLDVQIDGNAASLIEFNGLSQPEIIERKAK